MQSESARMSSAAEARFRIDYPNSEPRVVKVVALDEVSERVVKRVAAPKRSGRTSNVSVSSAGTGAQAAAVIGEACAARKVMTMALVIGTEQRSDEELSRTLAALRPYASMLVIASGDEYIEEMLAALRA